MSAERIKINYAGIDGSPHEAYITPLMRKEGVLVLHKLIESFADVDFSNVGMGLLRNLDGETFWEMACKLLKYSTIDLKECKDLNLFDGFNTRFSDLYALVFEALKANYPDFLGEAIPDPIDSTGPVKAG